MSCDSQADPRTDTDNTVTSLAYAIKEIDEDEDSRACKDEHCHGSLTTTDGGIVICRSCRCTPDGIYYPPQRHDDYESNPPHFGTIHNPKDPPRPPHLTSRNGDDREEYIHSKDIILPGGFTAVYDADEGAGDGDEYEFALGLI